MPSAFRNPKNLSEWIELDYHERPRGLRRWKRLLAWGTFALCLAGVVVALNLPSGPRLVQAGPLSAAHGMFNDDCARCHRDSFQTVKKLAPWNATSHAVTDEACLKCHQGSPHNPHTLEAPACAGCHREHRGRPFLTRVPDGHCTSCHADLKKHRRGGEEGLAFQNVHAFNTDHPEFALFRPPLKADPAQLRFNHKVHLKSGGVRGAAGDTVQLDCVKCHKIDEAGRYSEPVNYTKHCAECHPLSVRLKGDFLAPGRDRERLDNAVRQFNAQPAPHDRPEVVRGILRERLLAFVQEFPLVAGDGSDRLFDSKLLGRRGTLPPSEAEWKFTRARLSFFEKQLFPEEQKAFNEQNLFQTNCRSCHIEEKREVGGAELSGLPVYRPTQLHSRWMEHARFRHDKHRMLDCKQCHAASESEKTSDVLMPRLATCQECHNPRTTVRHDCAACHTYHDRSLGGKPHQGMTIDQCLGR